MSVNLSIKNVPDALAARLRERAQRNHRSLQGELMAILEAAGSGADRADSVSAPYRVAGQSAAAPDGLLERLMAIAGKRGIDTSRRLSREQAHDRKRLRKLGV
jgi:plasmid stability protein